MCSNFYTNPDILIDELTNHKVAIVKESWLKMLELGDETVGRVLFKNLFETDEELIQMFRFTQNEAFEDIPAYAEHITKVIATLSMAIDNIDKLASLLPILNNLGEVHVGLGVTKADYDTIGSALMLSLE